MGGADGGVRQRSLQVVSLLKTICRRLSLTLNTSQKTIAEELDIDIVALPKLPKMCRKKKTSLDTTTSTDLDTSTDQPTAELSGGDASAIDSSPTALLSRLTQAYDTNLLQTQKSKNIESRAVNWKVWVLGKITESGSGGIYTETLEMISDLTTNELCKKFLDIGSLILKAASASAVTGKRTAQAANLDEEGHEARSEQAAEADE